MEANVLQPGLQSLFPAVYYSIVTPHHVLWFRLMQHSKIQVGISCTAGNEWLVCFNEELIYSITKYG